MLIVLNMNSNNEKPYSQWLAEDWKSIKANVTSCQKYIYNSAKTNNFSEVWRAQHYLIMSREAKLLAIDIVMTSNGALTPGVDRWLALGDFDKYSILNVLNLDGTADCIRRVYIPKPGTLERRPIGIPTIIDRCKQSLAKLALEPELEARFESNSFGFRPGRKCADVVAKVRAHLIFKGPSYVLDADIKKCFDRIDHTALVNKMKSLPIIVNQVVAWLRAGILDDKQLVFPREGTPQGGIISPILANLALDGLQDYISGGIKHNFGFDIASQTYYIRYADDFLVLGPSFQVVNYAKILCTTFLNGIGLEIKEEKTKIIKTLDIAHKDGKIIKVKSESFDFLGFRFKQRYLSKHKTWQAGGHKTHITSMVLIDPKRIQRHKASISALLRSKGSAKDIIESLNLRIEGWCSYFRNSDVKRCGDLPRKMDLWLNGKIRKWVRRTTKLRGKNNKFWKTDTKDWIFYHKDPETEKELTLKKYSSYHWSTNDYRAIESKSSPFQIK